MHFTESEDEGDRETPEDPAVDSNLNRFGVFAGRLGLDFFLTGVKAVNRQLDDVVASVEPSVVSSMASTGFVTFLDLKTVTCAASAPLTHKPNSLQVEVASEARDLIWDNVPYSAVGNNRRESNANILLALGALLWSIPLASIQAIASAEKVGTFIIASYLMILLYQLWKGFNSDHLHFSPSQRKYQAWSGFYHIRMAH